MTIEGYSINDWFYEKSDTCSSSSEECSKNREAASRYDNASVKMDVSSTQYQDLLALYNRELLFMANMIIGLGFLCYYIYLNQSVFTGISVPSVASISGMVPTIGNKATSGTSTS